MGQDCVIFIKTKEPSRIDFAMGGDNLRKLNPTVSPCFRPYDSEMMDRGCTLEYEIDGYSRFYHQTYARGYFPHIAYILFSLLDNPAVEEVYYFGDSAESPPDRPFSKDDMRQLVEYFLAHGNRVYKETSCQHTRHGTEDARPLSDWKPMKLGFSQVHDLDENGDYVISFQREGVRFTYGEAVAAVLGGGIC